MVEEIKIDEKFKESALFDLDFEANKKKSMEYSQANATNADKLASSSEEQEKYYEKQGKDLDSKTSAMRAVESSLNMLKNQDPKLKAQAEAYLSTLINQDAAYIASNDRTEKLHKTGKDKIDLDGSKKSLWGKLKNKAKDFLYPNNVKKTLESQIENLKKDMIANPSTYEWLKECARPEGKSYDSKEKVSFSQLNDVKKEISVRYNNERVDNMHAKESAQRWGENHKLEAATKEATIEAIHQVREKAAKVMEQKAMARDTVGIKDVNANTGVDRLADKAKAMEGMSPQQRLAMRLADMRGTAKEEAKPTVKREMDSNILGKTLGDKVQGG